MPPHEHIVRVIKEWVGKAENDYRAGVRLLSSEDDALSDVVGFHAQQCVEKYLKAVLIAHSLPVPKTHDIEKIIALLPPPAPTANLTPEQMRWMTEFAADSRYPGGDAASKTDAEEAMRTAERIRVAVRAILPPETLENG